MNHDIVSGGSFAFIYSDETYHIEILSETHLRWTRTKGKSVGQSDQEQYIYSRLSDEIGLITWIEADGLGLSNTLHYANMTVTTHANMDRDVFRNAGKLELVTPKN